LNVHAGLSLDTFLAEIIESGASRVFARFALGYGHDPEVPVDEAAAFTVSAWQPLPAAMAGWPPPPPHAAITSAHTPSKARAMRFELALIRTPTVEYAPSDVFKRSNGQR
jgi:hypothetical protein